MKTGIAAAIGMVLGGAVLVQPVLAANVPLAAPARTYQTWMARAMDPCSPATVSVVTGFVPSNGCIQANSTTDSTLTMKFAKLTVSAKTGKITLIGSGFTFGNRVGVQLKLRVTKPNQSTKHPPALSTVTFQDVTIMCPNAPFWFVARPNGSIAGKITLTDCLNANGEAPGLATGSIEVLDSALVNIDSTPPNKVFARPGFVR